MKTNNSIITKLALIIFMTFFMAFSVQADEMGTVNTSKAQVDKIQKFIEQLKSSDHSIEEITILATGTNGDTMKIACTTPGVAGTPADPEDIDAIIENKVVIIPEGSSLDITVPMVNKEGMPAAVAGIVISTKDGLDNASAKEKAIALTKRIEKLLIEK